MCVCVYTLSKRVYILFAVAKNFFSLSLSLALGIARCAWFCVCVSVYSLSAPLTICCSFDDDVGAVGAAAVCAGATSLVVM